MIPGTILEGRFVIEHEAGSGGMGVVFCARDRLSNEPVAIKVLRSADSRDIRRFEREAAVLAELRHPGIVRYVAHGINAVGQHYLVMEWLEGESLESRLGDDGLTGVESLMVLRKAAEALAFAHARGMVHRDIKPSNLFLVGGAVERLKLLDFGIAGLARASRKLTQTGVVLGTPGYMAPEQIQASPVHDARTDVFSLGCVAFECLTGRPAFEGMHPMALFAKILLQDVPRLGELRKGTPAPLEDLVARMLAKDPKDRPQDIAAVVAELAQLGELKGPWAERTPNTASEPGPTLRSRAPTLTRAVPSLTLIEQRMVSVVLARHAGVDAKVRAQRGWAEPALRAAVDAYGGHLNLLANGSMIVTISRTGGAVDRAQRAAQCALTLAARFPDVPVCVVTGRGMVSGLSVEGDVIDRGVRTLDATRPGTARLDSVTADMLDERFLVDRDGSEIVLRGQRLLHESTPLLLGRRTPCLGRSRELAMLQGVYAGCAGEPVASVVLVLGAAGAGKSRVRREFLDRISQRGEPVEILFGRGDSLGESSPFGMIADAIRRAAGIRDGEPLESRQEKLAARLSHNLEGKALARVTAFLGELVSTPFPDEDNEALRAARDNPMLMGDSMQASWENWLAAECAMQPVVLVLEDLQWGDAATVRLVDATLRSLRELPLMVLVLARPEVHTRFPVLWPEREVQVIKIGPLSRKASEQIVRDALGAAARPEVVAQIVDRADGNPFYVEELVRAVAAGRDTVFPDSVLGTVEARLDAEGTEAKRVLRAASVFGDRFSRGGVAALLGGDRHLAEACEWLEVLAARELISPVGMAVRGGDADYMFRHALVREAAYATLTEADRELGHRLAGEWLEQIGHGDAMAMAEHFRRGGEPARAVRHYRRAAEQALEANDLTAVLERAERGVACGAAGEALGALRLVEAEANLWRGELALAEQLGLEAIGLLPLGSTAWFHALTQMVIAAGKLGDVDRVEEWVAPATCDGTEKGAVTARLVCLSECAAYLIFGGRYAAAEEVIAALDRAEALDARAVASIQQTRSISASVAGDPGACLEGLERALVAFEQAADQRNAGVTRANVGFILAELGDFRGAEESLRAALAAADRMGLRDLAAAALHNLGRVLAYRGSLDEARRLEQRAVEGYQRQGDQRMEGSARVYLAQIALLASDPSTAEAEARAAAAGLVAAPPLRAGALAVLARALLHGGRAEEALAAASEAHALLESLGTIEEGEAMVRLVHAEALEENGKSAEFARAIEVARDRLLERAAKIKDPVWSERFLTAVPDNASTLALAVRALPGNERAQETSSIAPPTA